MDTLGTIKVSFQAMKDAGMIRDFEVTVDHKQFATKRGTVYDVKVMPIEAIEVISINLKFTGNEAFSIT